MAGLYNILKDRGYLYQYTDEGHIQALLKKSEPITFYLGVDPTADSLHIGHFFALMMFRYLQEAGHRGILVVGGATAMVGDPTGKSDLRKMLSLEEVEHNIREVSELARRFIIVDGDNPAIILNNGDWINNYSYINFLRDIGIHFNVNTMLNSDACSKRLKQGGLTYLEMGYMLMQAYDFVYLNRNYDCTMQIGGSDQWGNIVAGISLSRKLGEPPLHGFTCPLLIDSAGRKMGKTESGALWVARQKTTVFDFYQYFYNVGDGDVEKLLKLFTRIPLDEIGRLISTDIRQAKRIMASEITELVHGREETQKVLQSIDTLFRDKNNYDNMPTATLAKQDVENEDIITLLVQTGFIKSRSEARRLIEQGGISINGERIEDTGLKIQAEDFSRGYMLLKRGRKSFLKVDIA